MIQLSEICSLITDGSHFSPKDEGTGYPMLSVKDMRDTDFDFSDCKYIGSEAYQKLVSTGCRPQVGDVVVAKDGSYLKSAFPITQDRDIVLLSSIAILRPDTTLVLPTYLSYYLKSPSVFRTVSLNYITGTALKRIILAGIRKLPIELPGIEEQQKRVKLLDIAYQIIQIRQRQLLALDTLIKARFVEMFGNSETNSRKWDCIKLGEICDLQNGYAFKSDDYLDHSSIFNCRMSNIRPGGGFDADYHPKFLPEAYWDIYQSYRLVDGDIIIAMTDMASDPKILGVPTIVKSNGHKFLLNQRVGKLMFRDVDRMNNTYVMFFLGQDYIRKSLAKSAGGSTQINVGKPAILNITILEPPRQLQDQFSAFVSQVDKSKVVVQKALDKAQLLFDGLMQQYFG